MKKVIFLGLLLTSCNPATFSLVEKEAEVAIEAAQAAEVVATETKAPVPEVKKESSEASKEFEKAKRVREPKPTPKPVPLTPVAPQCLKTQEG